MGQDARGAWAWIIRDRYGAPVASGDGLPDRFLALEIAASVYRGVARRQEADLDRAIHFLFPDEAYATFLPIERQAA